MPDIRRHDVLMVAEELYGRPGDTRYELVNGEPRVSEPRALARRVASVVGGCASHVQRGGDVLPGFHMPLAEPLAAVPNASAPGA